MYMVEGREIDGPMPHRQFECRVFGCILILGLGALFFGEFLFWFRLVFSPSPFLSFLGNHYLVGPFPLLPLFPPSGVYGVDWL